MKLLFKNNKNIMGAIYLYNSFGPPNAMPLVARRAPALLGKDFYEAATIDFEIRNLENGYMSLFMHLFGENLNVKTEAKCKEIIRKMEKAIYIPKEYNAKLLRDVENKFRELYVSKEARITKEIKNMFGFKLPASTTMAVSGAFYTDGKRSSGGQLFSTSNDIFMALEVSYSIDMEHDMDTLFAVFIHELLHGLIGQNSLRIKRDSDYFEEALLDYFAPYGLLTQRLGLTNGKDAEKCHNVNIMNRPYASAMAQRLLPHMKRYYKRQDSTVWEYLAKKGFGKYIKTVF